MMEAHPNVQFKTFKPTRTMATEIIQKSGLLGLTQTAAPQKPETLSEYLRARKEMIFAAAEMGWPTKIIADALIADGACQIGRGFKASSVYAALNIVFPELKLAVRELTGTKPNVKTPIAKVKRRRKIKGTIQALIVTFLGTSGPATSKEIVGAIMASQPTREPRSVKQALWQMHYNKAIEMTRIDGKFYYDVLLKPDKTALAAAPPKEKREKQND